jgi:hypothetical protein
MTQVTTTGKVSLLFSRFKKMNAYNLILFVILPLIPSIAVFLGSYIVGWHNFHRQREFLSYDASIKLSFIIYFFQLLFILIMAFFISYITNKTEKENGYLYCLNYCTYLYIPFSLLSVSAITPNIFILCMAFFVAIAISFHQLESTVDGFLGLESRKTRENYFIPLVITFFFLLLGMFTIVFFTMWPEYFNFIASFFNKPTK